MSTESTFESVLDKYLRAIEAEGSFDSAVFLKAHPEHCEALREFIAMQKDFGKIIEPLRHHLASELSLAKPMAPHATDSTERFRKLRLHAEGGLGRIYLAQDTELNRTVALKEIKEVFAHDSTSLRRFRREAEIPSGLEHPGIVPVFGRGISGDGRPYYAMRFVEGETLKEVIKQFHTSNAGYHSVVFRRLLNRYVEVCNAIAYAHSRGVLHRDLKPGNIMLGKFGETQIVDWGLAKQIARKEEVEVTITNCADETASPDIFCDDASPTDTGIAIGTLPYMSPEQADGRIHDLSPATDIYSLGATLYALLTGKIPYEGINNYKELLTKVREGNFASPRQVKPEVPKALAAIALKAMAHKPQDRYATALELAKEIEQYLADEPVVVLRDPMAVRLQRWMRKHPGTVTGLTAAVLVGLIGLGSGLYFVGAEKVRTEKALDEAVDARTKEAAALEQETIARDSAEKAAKDAKAANELTQKRLIQIEKGNQLLGSIFADLDIRKIAENGEKIEIVLGSRLKKAAAQLQAEEIGNPLVVADLQQTLGWSLLGLGDYEEAIALLKSSKDTRVQLLGLDHRETLGSMGNLAEAYRTCGEFELALPHRSVGVGRYCSVPHF